MSTGAAEFESLLREALSPVEPPAGLDQRLEQTLVSLTELAQEELDSWELSAMRDPRNWARPAAALVLGGAAASGLLVLRARRRARESQQAASGSFGAGLERSAERAVRELAQNARELLERTRRS
jgi:hypothetical protein